MKSCPGTIMYFGYLDVDQCPRICQVFFFHSPRVRITGVTAVPV